MLVIDILGVYLFFLLLLWCVSKVTGLWPAQVHLDADCDLSMALAFEQLDFSTELFESLRLCGEERPMAAAVPLLGWPLRLQVGETHEGAKKSSWCVEGDDSVAKICVEIVEGFVEWLVEWFTTQIGMSWLSVSIDICWPGASHRRLLSTKAGWSSELCAEYDSSLSQRWTQGGPLLGKLRLNKFWVTVQDIWVTNVTITAQVHVFCSNGNPETPFAPENYGATVTRGPGVEIQPKHKITLPSPHFMAPWSKVLGMGFFRVWKLGQIWGRIGLDGARFFKSVLIRCWRIIDEFPERDVKQRGEPPVSKFLDLSLRQLWCSSSPTSSSFSTSRPPPSS